MTRRLILLLVWASLGAAWAQEPPRAAGPRLITPSTPGPRPVADDHAGARILMYFPNRLHDLMDLVRLRFRAGPGFAADARLTQYGAFFVGGYYAHWAGLPGPRQQPVDPVLTGEEERYGLEVMGVDATDDTTLPPHYSPYEINLGFHAVVGVDTGLDVTEIWDFLAGLFTFDPKGDDQ